MKNSNIKSNKSYDNNNKYLYHKASTMMTDVELDESNNHQRQHHHHHHHKTNSIATSSSQMYKYQIEYPFKTIKHKTNNISITQILKLAILFLVNFILMLPILVYLALIYSLNELFKHMFKLFHLCHLTKSSMLSPNRVPEFLRPMELFWLYNSSLTRTNQQQQQQQQNNDRNICSCIVFVEGQLNKKNVKDLIQNRIISSNNRTGQRFLVRFTQRLYRLFAYYYVWLDCDETTFNLDDHVIEVDNLLEINTHEQLQNYVAQLISTHEFNLTKPLWNIYYKKTFGGNGAEPTTVLIFLFHMCFADGVSLVRLFFKTLVDNRNAIDIKSRFAYNRYKIDMIRQFFFSFNKIFYYLFCKKRDNNPLNRLTKNNFKNLSAANGTAPTTTTPNETKSKQQVLRWSEPFSLVLINRLKLVTRSKLNDFFISIVAGIIREYLQKHGINNPKNVHCLMPVNLKSNRIPFDLSNQTVLSSIKLPTNTEGTIPRLWSTKLTSSRLKYSSDYLFLYFFVCVVFNALPHWLAVRLIRYLVNKNTLIASTLGAGDNTLSTVSLCNKNVRNILFVYPTLCKLSISFSIITYGDEVRLTLLADSDIIKHPEQITQEFNKQLETLNYLLANRRMPGEIRRGIKTNLSIFASNNNNNNTIPIDSNKLASAASSIINPSDNNTTTGENTSIEEMQLKLNQIHNELQTLTDVYSKIDSSSSDFNKQKQMLNIKKENLKIEFRQILHILQLKKNSIHKTIPSDDEDELDPKERVRLRSSSIVSKVSSQNNSRKFKDPNSGRASVSYSRQNSRASISNSASGYLKSSSNVNIRNEIETSNRKKSENEYSNRLN